MAITIKQTPQDFSTVYNPYVVTCSSTNVAQPKFNFIFEIYDSTNTTLLRTLRVPPEINYSYGVSDISRVLEDYIGTDFFKKLAGTEFKDCYNSYLGFSIRIGEEYEVASVITQYLNLYQYTQTVVNASLKYSSFVNYNAYDYELDGVTKKLLTNITNRKVDRTDEGFINFMGCLILLILKYKHTL